MKKNPELVAKCLLDSSEVCDPNCEMFNQCWDEEEIKKKNEQDN